MHSGHYPYLTAFIGQHVVILHDAFQHCKHADQKTHGMHPAGEFPCFSPKNGCLTSDPTQVAQNFFNTGHDVVLSGIDTTEALTVAGQKKKEGKNVWAIPYDYVGACQGAPDVCLGVPYFNWGPAYIPFVKAAMSKTWKQEWLWLGPDWKDINNPDTSIVGFVPGQPLPAGAKPALDQFVKDLGSGAVNLFKGPLNYQDGTVYVKAGETAGDKQIWHMEQLLQGMQGQSSAKK